MYLFGNHFSGCFKMLISQYVLWIWVIKRENPRVGPIDEQHTVVYTSVCKRSGVANTVITLNLPWLKCWNLYLCIIIHTYVRMALLSFSSVCVCVCVYVCGIYLAEIECKCVFLCMYVHIYLIYAGLMLANRIKSHKLITIVHLWLIAFGF